MKPVSEHEVTYGPNDPLSAIVRIFLDSKLSIILILFSLIVGVTALYVTSREEDPQIVVPLADIYVHFPGHSASEVEQLIATPLERILYQVDGVEYVYSMSRENQAIITVRFFVGQDRERSLVKLFKKLDENREMIPPGVAGWVLKPVEIDDVPIVTLALKGQPGRPIEYDCHTLRRLGEEIVSRLAELPQVSRAEVIGGEPREVRLDVDPDRLRGYHLSLLDVQRAIQGANLGVPSGTLVQGNQVVRVDSASSLASIDDVRRLVIGISQGRPVKLQDVAQVRDTSAEIVDYVRHGWGPAKTFEMTEQADTGDLEIASGAVNPHDKRHLKANSNRAAQASAPAVTLAISKQKGANSVTVAASLLEAADRLRDEVLPDDVELLVTRNYGHSANEKVNELVEGLGVAIVIVIALLTISLGWREAFIVAVAVPVVFGLTLAVNYLFGYTINRVTLFALILALGLLVDDPIVDVENISRHFEEKKKATKQIVLEAVAEIRPPLISATLAVIVSFLPMFYITGMMGPYMSPMALNVPISMLMSMLVAFTITPWLSYYLLKGKIAHGDPATSESPNAPDPRHNSITESSTTHDIYDPEVVQRTLLYRFFKPLMLAILGSRLRAIGFLLFIAAITLAAMGMAVTRAVPLKMLPFDNKNEWLLVVDLNEGTSLEQTSAVVAAFEERLAFVPEVVDYTSYVGTPGPIDFNGLVRHYYLRRSPHQAEVRVSLVGKKERRQQSHAITLRLRDELTALGQRYGALVRLVELPPGPPVLASIVAEVYGEPDQSYAVILDSAQRVSERLQLEPGLVEVDDVREASTRKLVFQTDQEKAALAGVSVAEIGATLQLALDGGNQDLLRVEGERNPLRIALRLPEALRSSALQLGQIHVKTSQGGTVSLAELGTWREDRVDQTIYHKNLQRVAYVFAECAGRPPAECILDIQADQVFSSEDRSHGVAVRQADTPQARPVNDRTYLNSGSGIAWSVPEGVDVVFSGEGEWKITLDVFRDLGLAFGAAMVMIYVILVAQTGSFLMPVVVMLAIPLTVIGVMPGFWLLNSISGHDVGGYSDPVYFTATAMIGMIALAGIVTRDSIILVDFIDLAQRHGRPLMDAILESRVVRLRPILLTAGAALLSSIPITLDPIFSGLGWSLIFGLISSTLFTLLVIPVSYWLLRAGQDRSTKVQ